VTADGRFAPSPSGPLHLGNLRTALLAWLSARSQGARFLLRVEDLDPQRSKPEYERQQIEDLSSLGLDWDGPVLRQSERFDVYDAAIADLAQRDLLYPCFCTRREVREAASAPHGELPEGAYPGTCRDLSRRARLRLAERGRKPALRLRADAARIEFADALLGERAGVVDDFVVRRADGVPAYNVAVVVDDALQGIGEVVRGADLLATTPRQILLARLLGFAEPRYVHVPLVLGPDGERLAKRHGAVTLADREALGEAPQQVLGWLARSAGLAPPREAYSAAELIESFDLRAIPREPTVFDG
jgi:glutamyl-tRNA synthetase